MQATKQGPPSQQKIIQRTLRNKSILTMQKKEKILNEKYKTKNVCYKIKSQQGQRPLEFKKERKK